MSSGGGGGGSSRLNELGDMTGSYSEICDTPAPEERKDEVFDFKEREDRPKELGLVEEAIISEGENSRPKELGAALEFLSQLEGTVTQHGDMISFVADNLETKIKLSSPREERSEIFPSGGGLWGSGSEVPAGLVAELEAEALRIAASVDSLTENLSEILHTASTLTVSCLETYRDVVCKACDAVDLNIKSMYQLMAKCEELSKSMAPIYKLAVHIKNIKHLLDLLEAN